MRDIESMYKKIDGMILIEIKLTRISQLFNSFDPAPFHEKEIDHNAENYIIDTVDDFPIKTRFMIVVYLPPDLAGSDEANKIASAIHNHFQYKMLVAERNLRNRFKYGRFALILGLSFLFVSLGISRFLMSSSTSLVTQLIADALLITGWAAMWEPVTVLLYELWPLRKTRIIYKKISTMEIKVLPYIEVTQDSP